LIFSSIEFIYLFLPATLALFHLGRRAAGLGTALGLLTLASIVFYGVWKPGYVPIFVGSILFNWAVSRGLGPGRRRSRIMVALGVAANLGLLFWFKYAAFVSEIAVEAGVIGEPLARRVLPLGISFFTFQQIAFLVDRHRGRAPASGLVRYALFVAFFPQLIAGPILHHAEVMPQLERPRVSWNWAARGLFVFTVGLAKKSVLADPLGEYASIGFGAPETLQCVNAWATVVAYTLQLYFDFSGYSDMAVGMGLMFGVQLPWNFLAPYRATSIAEFWRRWHITLSNFLRDYVYLPLGGSRGGLARTMLNLMVTFLLGGIWHGAGWTFVLWGLLHGVAVSANHAWRATGLRVPRVLGWAGMIVLVVGGWVLFRAASLEDARTVYRAMGGVGVRPMNVWDHGLYRAAPYLVAGLAVAGAAPSARSLSERFRPTLAWGVLGAALLAISMVFVLGQTEAPEFLYFDF